MGTLHPLTDNLNEPRRDDHAPFVLPWRLRILLAVAPILPYLRSSRVEVHLGTTAVAVGAWLLATSTVAYSPLPGPAALWGCAALAIGLFQVFGGLEGEHRRPSQARGLRRWIALCAVSLWAAMTMGFAVVSSWGLAEILTFAILLLSAVTYLRVPR